MTWLRKEISHRQNLYELSWNFSKDGKLALDLDTGILIDINPAFEALMGYSRKELIGMHTIMLHPESERKRVQHLVDDAGRSGAPPESFVTDLHIQRKDGRRVPVTISSSESLQLAGRSLGICEFHDMTERVERENQLTAQNWALSAFSVASLALGRAQSSESLLQSICDAITSERGSSYVLAWVGIADDEPGKPVRVAAAAGSALCYLDGPHLSWSEDEPQGRGQIGACIRTNTLQVTVDTETSPAFELWRERARQFGIRSSVAIPLYVKDSWRGALAVYAARASAFEAAPIEVFQRLAEQIVHGVHSIELNLRLDAERLRVEEAQKNLTEALASSVAAIVTAMEMRDPYTAGHQSRTAEIAYAIGKEMGWPEERLQGLRMAAMVHDVGKISIPAEILTKPTRLSAAEMELIQEHPETGFGILKKIPFSWPIADFVRQHHEKLDGSGYPLGLKGDAILPEARILAVADIVEAMASHRPYRPGIPLEIVLKEIEKQAGSKLDGEVVRICATLFREKRLVLPGMNQH
jgi:PAS domain S-box-containing protein